MSFKHVDNVERDTISIFTILAPKPIVRELGVDVDCHPPCMRASISSILDGAAVECTCTRKCVFLELWRKSIVTLRGQTIRMSTPRIQLRTSHIGRDLVSYSIRASAAGAAIKRRGTGKWDRRVAQSFQGM